MSRFDPSDAQLKAAVIWAQARSERLAARIVGAREALKSGQNGLRALAILDGREEDQTAATERPEFVGPTPLADGLLDFGEWET